MHETRRNKLTKGVAEIAQKTESIYKALSDGAKPRFDTILRIMQALNIKPQYVLSAIN